MKKLIIISSLLLTLVIGVSSVSTVKGMGPITPLPSSNFVYYKVNIFAPLQSSVTCNLIVVITDGSGQFVTIPQGYKDGSSTYYFYELGNVKGVRVAKLMVDPRISAACSIDPVAEYRHGTFLAGQQYNYLLFPDGMVTKTDISNFLNSHIKH